MMTSFKSASRNSVVRYIGTAHDLIVAAAAFFAAYVTVFDLDRALLVPGIWEKTAGFVAISGLSYFLFSVHRGSWRYVSIPDLTTIIKASVVAVLVYTVAAFLLTRGQNVPRSVPLLTLLFLVGGLSSSRLAYRLLMEQIMAPGLSGRADSKSRIVLLCGYTDKAESFIRSLRRAAGNGIRVAGILDEARINHSRMVQGVRVIGSLSDLSQVVERLAKHGTVVSELVITENAPGRRRLGNIVETAMASGLKVTRIPDITDTALVTSTSILEPKPIELGDLLERPEINADLEGVARLISGKAVLATGAGGSIGSELCRQIAMFGPKSLTISDSSEFHLYRLDMELREAFPDLHIVARIVDVRDNVRIAGLFQQHQPEIVFHAAALKHVPLVEDNPLEGIKTNILGTRNVANAAIESKASTFVMISTDKAVNPTNVMGATKRAAEAYCQALDLSSDRTRFKTVRFGNVLGSNGSVVPRFKEQIANGGPITVTHPQIVRYFMTIPEAVRLVLHASAHALRRQTERGKIMVLDMGKPVRIVDLAERMIQLAGFKPRVDIDIVYSGLRPGEKLYEELFDPSEVQDERTEEGYVVASPRVIDQAVMRKSLNELENAVAREDHERALELLKHLVPEYRKENETYGEPVELDDHVAGTATPESAAGFAKPGRPVPGSAV